MGTCVCLYKALLGRTGACLISGSNQSRNMDKLLLLNPALSLGVSILSFPVVGQIRTTRK